MPAAPTNAVVNAGDFSLQVTTDVVFGASFYTFEFNGAAEETSTPSITFDQLRSGQNYMIVATATKITGYGNFTSELTTINAATSN